MGWSLSKLDVFAERCEVVKREAVTEVTAGKTELKQGLVTSPTY